MLTLLLLSTAAALAYASCSSSADCEMLGTCEGGACSCFPGWRGPTCGSLALVPSPASTSTQWPLASSPNSSSWGFTRVFDPSDGQWHALACVACGRTGVIGDGGGESFIVHLVSSSGTGNWTLHSRGLWAPQTTFGPHLARARDGTFVAVFRVNLLLNSSMCPGDAAAPAPPPFAENPSIPYSSLISGDPEKGSSIYIAWASEMAGPWSVVKTNITGLGSLHVSNPSIQPLLLGGWGMALRYNFEGEQNAFALADDFRGPWRVVANISGPKGNNEDPWLFQLATQPGIVHALFHNGPYGYHSWGYANGTSKWPSAPGDTYAFTLGAELDNGKKLAFNRRERPELAVKEDGTVVGLINGVTLGSGNEQQAFSFLQTVEA
jgi:hypothetical protein